MSADVDQLTGRGVGPGIRRFAHGLVATANRGEGQHRKHRVEQPASGRTAQLSTRADEHPDHQRQQGRRPHPGEDLIHRGAERHQEETAYSHEQCRCRRPSLWLVGEPHRKQGQHRPAQRQSTQNCASYPGLRRRDEWGSDEERSSDGPCGQRASDNPTNVSPGSGIRARLMVLSVVLGGGDAARRRRSDSHDGDSVLSTAGRLDGWSCRGMIALTRGWPGLWWLPW